MTRKAILGCLLMLMAAVPSIGQQSGAAGVTAKPRFGTWGVDLTPMDRSVKPGDSFWHFVNGSWNRSTEIPADRTNAGVSVLLVEEAERQVRSIVEDLARDSGRAGGAGRQVGDFYASWMDTAAIEANGTAPLKPYFAKIDAVRNRSDLLKLFATPGYATPVEVGIIPDPADPSRYVAAATEGGLGLPSRDFYLLTGQRYDAIRAAYRTYVVTVHQLAGIGDADAKAQRLIDLETALAKVYWEPARRRDIKQIYNPMNRTQLNALAPQFEWVGFLKDAGLGEIATVVAMETTAITEVGKMLDSVPLSTWKEYVAFHFLRTHAEYLPKAFDEAHFKMVLDGAARHTPAA